jgi:uncharacterized protein
MKLRQLPGDFAIARYAPDIRLNAIQTREFCSITRTRNEVTVVCESEWLPAEPQKRELGWVCLEVDGPLDFDLSQVIDQLTGHHGRAEVKIFALSTYDTDYVLVKRDLLNQLGPALQKAGISITRQS